MKALFNYLLIRRAGRIANRLQPFLPPHGPILDIGSGTGHNAELLRQRFGLSVIEADVSDMSVTGSKPLLFDGEHLPFKDEEMECGLLLFVLHYASNPDGLLREAHRVISRRLIVLQSTYSGPAALAAIGCRDFFQGRFAFIVAKRIGLIEDCECSMQPQVFYDRDLLESLFHKAGWKVIHHQPQNWGLLKLSRDLYILEKA